jgi:hypothetical protein
MELNPGNFLEEETKEKDALQKNNRKGRKGNLCQGNMGKII